MNENGHNLHAHLYEQQVLNEEYKIWKKYTPFYYDLVITHLLEWPSLTVEWLPINEISDDSNYKVAKLVLGTFTSGNEPNYLMVAKVGLGLISIGQDSQRQRLYKYR
jgi:histone-binding protein RBBP4